jgi:tRNA nucleotidyltransferase/poly(A) polymerase
MQIQKYSVPSDIIALRQLEFVDTLVGWAHQVYLVGGAVRDMLLNREVKDYDLLVIDTQFRQDLVALEIPQGLERIKLLIEPFGVVNIVGESFGILKFRPHSHPELEFDIAVPRTETKVGEGHQGFVVNTENVTLEEDLLRRDFTINAIALDLQTFLLVDPYKGYEDIQNKLIRVVNPQAFHEDPLRMLRAAQFAARFMFELDERTVDLIRENAHLINQISGERIYTEFEKIALKGNPGQGGWVLINTGIFEALFGEKQQYSRYWLRHPQTTAELVWFLTYGLENVLPETFWVERLHGDIDGLREIEALRILQNQARCTSASSIGQNRYVVHQAYLKSSRTLKTTLYPDVMRPYLFDLASGSYPKTLKEVEIKGTDLLEVGYQGKVVGDALKAALLGIYSEEVRNEKAALLAFVQERLPLVKHEDNEHHPVAGGSN